MFFSLWTWNNLTANRVKGVKWFAIIAFKEVVRHQQLKVKCLFEAEVNLFIGIKIYRWLHVVKTSFRQIARDAVSLVGKSGQIRLWKPHEHISESVRLNLFISCKRRHVDGKELIEISEVLTNELISAVSQHVLKLIVTILPDELSYFCWNARVFHADMLWWSEQPPDINKHFEIQPFDHGSISVSLHGQRILSRVQFRQIKETEHIKLSKTRWRDRVFTEKARTCFLNGLYYSISSYELKNRLGVYSCWLRSNFTNLLFRATHRCNFKDFLHLGISDCSNERIKNSGVLEVNWFSEQHTHYMVQTVFIKLFSQNEGMFVIIWQNAFLDSSARVVQRKMNGSCK